MKRRLEKVDTEYVLLSRFTGDLAIAWFRSIDGQYVVYGENENGAVELGVTINNELPWLQPAAVILGVL